MVRSQFWPYLMCLSSGSDGKIVDSRLSPPFSPPYSLSRAIRSYAPGEFYLLSQGPCGDGVCFLPGSFVWALMLVLIDRYLKKHSMAFNDLHSSLEFK